MLTDIEKMLPLLDEVIEQKVEMKKGLTFNPFDPAPVQRDSYMMHNPYVWCDDGFMPMDAKYWGEQAPESALDGKVFRPQSEDAYNVNEEFYRKYVYMKGLRGLEELSALVKSDAPATGLKKMAAPIGTVHTYSNGIQYVKVAEGKWLPKQKPKQGAKPEEVKKPRAAAKPKEPKKDLHAKIEEHHARTKKQVETIKQHIAAKEQEHKMRTIAEEHAASKTSTDPAKKIGRDVSEEDVGKYLESFEPDFQALESMDEKLKAAGATHFASRLKDRTSLFEKMKGRYADKPLGKVADVIGARGLAENLKDQKKMLQKIQKIYKVTEVKDNSEKPRDDGYRAIHVLFETPSGKTAELQIKTHMQQIFAGFAHDAVYKGTPEIKKDPEVNQFMKDISDYLHDIDLGYKPKSKPKEPKILKKAGIEFPWDEIRHFGAGAVAQVADQKMKYYAVKRDEDKTNRVFQFDSFKDAKKFQKQAIKGGHKGEVPVAYAANEKEFLETFNEYQPENWREIAKIREKVKRQPAGKGKEIKLTAEELDVVLSSGKFALISAGRNPTIKEDMAMSDKDIKARDKKLKEELQKAGYMFTPARGQYEGVEEDSFLVMAHDADKDHMIELGKSLNQNSIIYADQGEQEMIFTTGENEGKKYKGKGWEDHAKAKDNYTEIKTADGKVRKFGLNFDWDFVKSLWGLRGLGILFRVASTIRAEEDHHSIFPHIVAKSMEESIEQVKSKIREALPDVSFLRFKAEKVSL